MRRSKLGGWRKVLVLGLLGCLGFGVVLAMVGGAPLWWAASTASELGDPTPVPTTLSVALEPVARLATGTGGATPGARLEIEFTDGRFDIVAGPPGSDVRIDGVMASNYYELVEERDGAGREGPVTAIRLRPTSGALVRMIASLRGNRSSAEANRLTVSIPPDRPVALRLDVSQGQSRIDLGGLTLVDLDAELSMGDHWLGFSAHRSPPRCRGSPAALGTSSSIGSGTRALRP